MAHTERRNAAATIDELIKHLTDIREFHGPSVYVKGHNGDELVVEVEQSKLTDGSEVYDVVIQDRYFAAA